jgi:hypothetical protein
MTTVGALLERCDASRVPADAVSRHLTAMLALPPFTQAVVARQVTAALEKVRDISMSDVLQRAWSVSRSLQRAGRESLTTGQRQTVHIEGFTVPVDYEAVLRIVIGEQRIDVALRLTVAVELAHTTAAVERGRLVWVNSEAFTVRLSCSVADLPAKDLGEARLNLALEVPLPRDGLPLVAVPA